MGWVDVRWWISIVWSQYGFWIEVYSDWFCWTWVLPSILSSSVVVCILISRWNGRYRRDDRRTGFRFSFRSSILSISHSQSFLEPHYRNCNNNLITSTEHYSKESQLEKKVKRSLNFRQQLICTNGWMPKLNQSINGFTSLLSALHSKLCVTLIMPGSDSSKLRKVVRPSVKRSLSVTVST